MPGDFIKSQIAPKNPDSEKLGFSSGKVIRNCDKDQKGRVLVRLAAHDQEVWARVVTPDTGVYFIPQLNEEVLLGFENGDITGAFVMGRLWHDKSLPPTEHPGDPVTKRVIHTPGGHDVTFDDKALTLTIQTKDGQKIALKPDGIELSSDSKNNAVITLDKSGNITIHAAQKISLNAANIELNATSSISIGATATQINIG